MKWFGFLKRNKEKRPLPPIRTVQEPAVARAERLAHDAEKARGREKPRSVHEIRTTQKPEDIDPIFADTGSLALVRETSVEGENPYDTHTWRQDPEEGLRRIDDSKAIKSKSERTPRKSKDKNNPYDTIVGRKGW